MTSFMSSIKDPQFLFVALTGLAVFATIFTALGIDYKKEYHVGARPIPIVDFGCKPVMDVLA